MPRPVRTRIQVRELAVSSRRGTGSRTRPVLEPPQPKFAPERRAEPTLVISRNARYRETVFNTNADGRGLRISQAAVVLSIQRRHGNRAVQPMVQRARQTVSPGSTAQIANESPGLLGQPLGWLRRDTAKEVGKQLAQTAESRARRRYAPDTTVMQILQIMNSDAWCQP
jgi:hypothetical protein